MADDDDFKPSTGRFARLAKLASLSAKLSTGVMARGVRRFAGKQEDPTVSIFGPGAAEKLVATLGDLKGLAMKLGQSIAMDPDLLTPEVRAVIARLQNQAPPMPWATVSEVVTRELGGPPEENYASFSEEPLASASLGQVHRAVTRDGLEVAVKVQYPDIAKALSSDLDNLGAMVTVVSASTRITHGKNYYSELRDSLLGELDYRSEADRLEVYAAAAKPFSELRVPRVVRALTSERVLTLELLAGATVKEFLNGIAERSAEEKFRVSRLLVIAAWGPFLAHGVAHADPHPGNFLLLPDGTLGVLDFGAVKVLSKPWLRANRRLITCTLKGQYYDVIGESVAAGMVFDKPDEARPFVRTVLDIVGRPLKPGVLDYGASGINREMRNHFMKNALLLSGIKPPPEAVQFFRAVGGMSQNLENIGATGDFASVFAMLEEQAEQHGVTVDP